LLYVTTSSKKILISVPIVRHGPCVMLLVRAPLLFGHLKLTAPPLWLAVALPIAYFTAAVVTVSLA